jgi:uncharacterized protein YceH (UPF0502 family)
MESSGGRVMRYAQNVGKVLGVPPQSVALLAMLFLRGRRPRVSCASTASGLHKFGDILSVEAFLNELAEKPFVRELAKQPGARETRWVHLLSGEPAEEAYAAPSAAASSGGITMSEVAALRANLGALQAEVAELRESVARIRKELGIS